MNDLFSEIVGCLQRNERIVLATIVSSSGSSPLPAGAMMLVKSGEGETVGTVGGGLLEALVTEEARKPFAEKRHPWIGRFDLNDDVSNEGMICGGNVDVLLEEVQPKDRPIYEALVRLRNDGSDAILISILDGAKNLSKIIYSSQHEALPDPVRKVAGNESERVIGVLRHSFGQEDIKRLQISNAEIVIQPIRGLQNLVIVGGGHVSRYLAQIATVAGFSTTVIDDREEFANAERFPIAARAVPVDYNKAFEKIHVKPSTYIVIVTRGHSSDEQVLEQAIRTPARYIGMIGSKRKVIACFENLAKRGIPLADLRRVHAPIGLDIGAVSAEEIAVSISAELIRVRRGYEGPSSPVAHELDDWFGKKS
jgi:xanthine dehydrogenase accessory factor